MYLESFYFPTQVEEEGFFTVPRAKVYDSFYPFQVLSRHQFSQIDFAPITILYGGNGSGKSTALNIIAEKITAKREANFNHSPFYSDYLTLCRMQLGPHQAKECRILTSDDVFDYMLTVRGLNDGVDRKREELFEAYYEAKYDRDFQFHGFEDYQRLREINLARSKTQSKFVKKKLGTNIRTFSNGESAYRYFVEQLAPEGLYLLDEPENSLAPALQRKLADWLAGAVRYDGCQLVIATHSPFLLALPEARVYDLDQNPVTIKPWTEVENVRLYRQFFAEHQGDFEDC